MGVLPMRRLRHILSIALITAVSKQPVLGLVMLGVIPVSVFLTIRQLISQKLKD